MKRLGKEWSQSRKQRNQGGGGRKEPRHVQGPGSQVKKVFLGMGRGQVT